MNKGEAINIIKPHLKKERFDHSLRVAETAVKLAELYDEPVDKVELAAILHDYAKDFSLDKLETIIKESDLPKHLLEFHHELWHGPAASVFIEHEHGITDSRIQSAIRYHTTGKANMSKFDMIIFVADYIEPGRSFPGVQHVREAAETNLNRAAWMALRNTIQFLVGKEVTVFPDTFCAYNDLTRDLDGGN